MGFLKRADAKFIEQAFEDTQRRDAIESLSRSRTVNNVVCALLALNFIVSMLLGFRDETVEQAIFAGVGGVFLALFFTLQVKTQSDLRMLLLVERLKKQS